MVMMMTKMDKRSKIFRTVIHEDYEDKESPCGYDNKQDDDVDITILDNDGHAIASTPPTIKNEMQTIFVKVLFSQTMVGKLVEDQGIIPLVPEPASLMIIYCDLCCN